MSSKTEYESYLTGIGEERERIIKLLEEHGHNPYSDSSCREGAECKSVASALALIKGEK